MSRAVVFKSVSGINCDMGVKPSPVRALGPHVARGQALPPVLPVFFLKEDHDDYCFCFGEPT
jgi:hypothetical protein